MDNQDLVAALDQRIDSEKQTIQAVRAAFLKELNKAGLDSFAESVEAPLVGADLRKDPYDGSETLYMEWRDQTGMRAGSILIHGTGQVFAELDIVANHPSKKSWFVEAVSAWGPRDALKSELKLLPALQ